MKILLIAFLAVCLPAMSSPTTVNLSLTNDVPIVEYGMRLALCDNSAEAGTERDMLNEKELNASKDIYWVLHNPSSTRTSIIFIGMTNSFDFKLFNTNGVETPKTAKGKAMSLGPQTRTSISDSNPHASRIGGGMEIREFPKLPDLFQFPSAGIYILEVRFWCWSPAKQRFILSEPVRVRVVKDNEKTVPREKPK
jgi:hypothetical protein